MRVFGNELMFTRFTGLTDGKTINILDILTSLAKNQKYSFTQNFMFLDSSKVYLIYIQYTYERASIMHVLHNR
jgi:hypothetical protein